MGKQTRFLGGRKLSGGERRKKEGGSRGLGETVAGNWRSSRKRERGKKNGDLGDRDAGKRTATPAGSSKEKLGRKKEAGGPLWIDSLSTRTAGTEKRPRKI